MATKTVKICDVYGTTNHVIAYRITVREPADINFTPIIMNAWAELGPRGLKRLLRFIQRGMLPPGGELPTSAKNDGKAPPLDAVDSVIPEGDPEPVPPPRTGDGPTDAVLGAILDTQKPLEAQMCSADKILPVVARGNQLEKLNAAEAERIKNKFGLTIWADVCKLDNKTANNVLVEIGNVAG